MIRSTPLGDRGHPVLVDEEAPRGSARHDTFRVVGLDVYLREYVAWAFSEGQGPVNGVLPHWSRRHFPEDADGFDSAIVPYIRSIRAAGFTTVSSCQGGWTPRETPIGGTAPLGTVYESARGIYWCPEPPHLYLKVGEGHGGGGVLCGVRACAKAGLDTPAASTVARRFRGMKPRVVADEHALMVILEGEANRPAYDVWAQLWWDEVLVRAGS